jgi:hypothetical protein
MEEVRASCTSIIIYQTSRCQLPDGCALSIVYFVKCQKLFYVLRSLPVPESMRRFSTTRLLKLWVRISPEALMFVCCECCVLLGRGLCDGLIIRPEESYQLWRVVVCDQETSKTRWLKPATGL